MPNRRADGRRVRELREQAGLRQLELAARARCSAYYLREIEHGRANPSNVMLYRLAAALGVTIDDFAESRTADQGAA
jgi:transcriptional regulator with XRE-family HTH domain